AAMECLKDCCKKFTKKKGREQETQVIALKMPPKASGCELDGGRRGVTEDYLLSKLPPDGRDVPFVLPTFKASYIQPRGSRYANLQSARCTYAQRKAELLGSSQFTYSPESSLHQGQPAESISPGSTRHGTLKNRDPGPQSPGSRKLLRKNLWLKNNLVQKRTYVIAHIAPPLHPITSSNVLTDSITLSGDERDLGKVCVRVNYQEALEQVWITVVQCSELNLLPDAVEQHTIGFKGIITIPKPIQFKSSIKDYCQDASFMETFVFALHLQQLRCSALVLRLQTHNPKKRTVAECVLSLRQLGPQETEHWLELNPPSKSSLCHAELQLTSCFQPVNGRIQLQVLAAQNLPTSSSPLTQAFFIKVEMHQLGRVVVKKKTRVLKALGGQCKWPETFHFHLASLDHACSLSVKLYSRSSVRRKQCLGQVRCSDATPVPEAAEQWKDTMAHPEKVVSAWHRLSAA
uniref:Tandem C2 domains, nuclear n=1 Tax=Cyclopterus lumpus TaxID=8103 RepID=A0A8C2WLN2_CYCLU